jgi:hypothetical protein
VLAVAGGAALALATLLPASQHPGHGAAAQLTAWTVVKQADGNIRVTIRELRDPAGLQRRLRADGVPASVTFRGQQNPACQGYRAVPATTSQRRHLMKSVVTFTQPGSYNVLIIHPSALPSDAGLVIENLVRQHPGSSLDVGLVQASPQCTGS